MFEKFKKGLRDLSALAGKTKLVNPCLVLVAGHFNESIDMREALKKIEWYPKAYFATVGPVLQKYQEILGKDANLTFANSFWERISFFVLAPINTSPGRKVEDAGYSISF